MESSKICLKMIGSFFDRLVLIAIHNLESELSQSIMAIMFTSTAVTDVIADRFILWQRPGPPKDPQ